MLKKQTVWLLTMLSLMIVLTIYYMMPPGNKDLAYLDNGKKNEETTSKDAKETEGDVVVDDVNNLGKDELYASIRLDLQDKRSMTKSRLKDIVASGSATTEEKNQALTEIDIIDELAMKESILEDSILATAEYQDVLVRHDGEVVHVHVKVDQLSKTEAVNIIQMVRDEFGDVTVDINFQPTGS